MACCPGCEISGTTTGCDTCALHPSVTASLARLHALRGFGPSTGQEVGPTGPAGPPDDEVAFPEVVQKRLVFLRALESSTVPAVINALGVQYNNARIARGLQPLSLTKVAVDPIPAPMFGSPDVNRARPRVLVANRRRLPGPRPVAIVYQARCNAPAGYCQISTVAGEQPERSDLAVPNGTVIEVLQDRTDGLSDVRYPTANGFMFGTVRTSNIVPFGGGGGVEAPPTVAANSKITMEVANTGARARLGFLPARVRALLNDAVDQGLLTPQRVEMAARELEERGMNGLASQVRSVSASLFNERTASTGLTPPMKPVNPSRPKRIGHPGRSTVSVPAVKTPPTQTMVCNDADGSCRFYRPDDIRYFWRIPNGTRIAVQAWDPQARWKQPPGSVFATLPNGDIGWMDPSELSPTTGGPSTGLVLYPRPYYRNMQRGLFGLPRFVPRAAPRPAPRAPTPPRGRVNTLVLPNGRTLTATTCGSCGG